MKLKYVIVNALPVVLVLGALALAFETEGQGNR